MKLEIATIMGTKLMSTKPFFSIIIPTYNNSHFLKAAILICLSQTFTDFEIVVVDDCSPDDTKKIVNSIKDKRIRYLRNTKNLGQEGNFKKAFSQGRGKYLFITGDDDYILWPDTLEKIHALIQEKGYGFVRLNLLERKFIGRGLRKSIIHYEKNEDISKDLSPEETITIFRKIAVGHMAGLIFKNEKNIGKKLFNLQETPWIKILYEVTKKYGAFYLANYYMVITWSQRAILTHYNAKPGRPIMIEDYTRYVFNLLPKERRDTYKREYFSVFSVLQPAIKLYSNNKNLKVFNKRLFQLEPKLKTNLVLWVMFLLAYIFPKSFWNMIRSFQHRSNNHLANIKNLTKVQKRFTMLEKEYISYER